MANVGTIVKTVYDRLIGDKNKHIVRYVKKHSSLVTCMIKVIYPYKLQNSEAFLLPNYLMILLETRYRKTLDEMREDLRHFLKTHSLIEKILQNHDY